MIQNLKVTITAADPANPTEIKVEYEKLPPEGGDPEARSFTVEPDFGEILYVRTTIADYIKRHENV